MIFPSPLASPFPPAGACVVVVTAVVTTLVVWAVVTDVTAEVAGASEVTEETAVVTGASEVTDETGGAAVTAGVVTGAEGVCEAGVTLRSTIPYFVYPLFL